MTTRSPKSPSVAEPRSFEVWASSFLQSFGSSAFDKELDQLVPAEIAARDKYLVFAKDSLLRACFGAATFKIDEQWGHAAWNQYRGYLERKSSLSHLTWRLYEFFVLNPVALRELVGDVVRILRTDYPNFEYSMGDSEAQFGVDLLAALGVALDDEPGYTMPMVFGGWFGPLVNSRPITGKKFRDTPPLLAAHLEFLLRSISNGATELRGTMPVRKNAGKPARRFNAQMVSATFPSAANEKYDISDEWVANTVKSFLRDNPDTSFTSWSSGDPDRRRMIFPSVDPSPIGTFRRRVRGENVPRE